MKTMVLLIVGMLCAVSAHAGDDIDTYLKSYSTMDKSGYQILTDYREHIRSVCKRDITHEEIEKFQKSGEYAFLLSTSTLQGSSSPDYKTTISSIGCE